MLICIGLRPSSDVDHNMKQDLNLRLQMQDNYKKVQLSTVLRHIGVINRVMLLCSFPKYICEERNEIDKIIYPF